MSNPQSIRAVSEIVERANRLEKRDRMNKIADQITEEKVTGFIVAGVSATVAGYLDGRFDLKSDDTPEDGVTVFGIPVMPVAAGLIAGGGLLAGGKMGSALGFSGLGIGSGWAFARASAAGRRAAEKAA